MVHVYFPKLMNESQVEPVGTVSHVSSESFRRFAPSGGSQFASAFPAKSVRTWRDHPNRRGPRQCLAFALTEWTVYVLIFDRDNPGPRELAFHGGRMACARRKNVDQSELGLLRNRPEIAASPNSIANSG